MTFVLLGTDFLGFSVLHKTQSAFYLHSAIYQLNNIVERLSLAKGSEEREQLINEWNIENKYILPDGVGVVHGVFPTYRIIITWGGSSPEHCTNQQTNVSGCFYRKIIF